MLHRISIILIILCLSCPAYAQKYVVDVQHFGMEDGLSSPVVNQITKDNRGFIWLATRNGLNRFDGNRFTPYFTSELASGITGVITDQNGIVWIFESVPGLQESNSIKALDPTSESLHPLEKFYPEASKIDVNGVGHWLATDQGIFLGGYRSSMYHFQDGNIQESGGTASTFHVPITWSRKYGIFTFSDIYNGIQPTGKIFHVNGSDSSMIGPILLGNIVEQGCLGVTPEGNLRYTAGHPGELNLTDQIHEYSTSGTILLEKSVSDLVGASVSSFSSLVFKHNPYSDETWLFYNDSLWVFGQDYETRYSGKISDDPSYSGKLNSVYFESETEVWASSQRGLIHIRANKLRFRQQFTSKLTGPLPKWGSNACRQILELDSLIILATDKGIVQIERPGSFKYLTSQNEVSLGFEYLNGQLIYCEELDLVSRNLATGAIEKIPEKEYEFSRNPWSLVAVSDSVWYVLGPEMLKVNFSKKQVVEQYPWKGSEKQVGNVYQLLEYANKFYLATDDGIFGFDPISGKLLDSYSIPDGPVPANHVHSISTDENGLWLSTADDGLLHWNPSNDSIRSYDTSDGLPSSVVYASMKDDRGFIWVSTDNGLSRFDPVRETFNNYGVEHGLTDFEFNRRSFHKGASGTFYFGSVNGFNYFDPADFWEDSSSLIIPLQVVALEQDNAREEKVDDIYSGFLQNQKIVLQPGDRFFNLEFKLLDYDAHRPSYAYKIDGYDQEWNYIHQNSVRISGLPGGEYVLKVKGQLANGTWSDQELAIPINVLIPFYKKPWFLASMFGLLVISTIGLIKWRTARLREQTTELELTVAKRTAELDTSLKQKEVLLKEIHHRVKNNLQIISSFIELETMGIEDNKTKQVLKQGRNRVKAMALIHKNLYQKDDLGHIAMQVYTLELLGAIMNGFGGVAKGIEIDIKMEGIDLDIDTAIPLGLILTELVTNAFKYAFEETDRGKIEISLSGSNDRYTMIMKDNGIGFPEKMKRRKGSLGLTLVDMLSEQMDGDVKYETDNGAKITLNFNGIETRKLED